MNYFTKLEPKTRVKHVVYGKGEIVKPILDADKIWHGRFYRVKFDNPRSNLPDPLTVGVRALELL